MDVSDTTWVDTTVAPERDYLYSVVTFAAGRQRSSHEIEVRYALPAVELEWMELSSVTATAQLAWTAYEGPRFAAYEVYRKAAGLDERIVKELIDVDHTTYTDSLLDGNTRYTYWISVRTTWENRVSSPPGEGIFYGLVDVQQKTGLEEDAKPHAVSLALDEEDGIYVAMTTMWTTTSRTMQGGIMVAFPGLRLRRFYPGFRPDAKSPIHVAADRGHAYVSVRSEEGRVLVGALDAVDGELWRRWASTENAFPVGLHLEDNGDVLMMDEGGWLYSFSSEGVPRDSSDALRVVVGPDLPLSRAMVAPGAGIGGDQFFLIEPERPEHRIVGLTRLSTIGFGGRSFIYDEGVGLEDGQILFPAAFAFDGSRARLYVLELQGRLQVFDTSPDAPRRYITRWGGSGSGDGAFQIPLLISAALEVDSAGRIYVADGSGRIQVFEP
jgi:hypothetical protein